MVSNVVVVIWLFVMIGNGGGFDDVVLFVRLFAGTKFFGGWWWETVAATDDVVNNATWQTLLPQQKLSADFIHEFTKEVNTLGAVTHIRLNIFPDGGVSRLRIFGKINR